MKTRIVHGALLVAVLTGSSATALAHHSSAMFDSEKEITITGEVSEFLWANPHTVVQVAVKDDKTGVALWNLECGATAQMARQGWRRSSLNTGDKVSVTLRPLRDGSIGGRLVAITLPDGNTLKY